ncbi:hypothetical protein GCM10009839_41050 [Catenulispora yoronensis]|uniref:Uncharacterized protein n=1 Tax=Catenulispora yoronensis TaxID=450799 RepID=A0ABP5FXA4_9ACTN
MLAEGCDVGRHSVPEIVWSAGPPGARATGIRSVWQVPTAAVAAVDATAEGRATKAAANAAIAAIAANNRADIRLFMLAA